MIKTIIQILVILKNAAKVKHLSTSVPFSLVACKFLGFLYREGLIQSYFLSTNGCISVFTVFLRYSDGVSVLINLKIVSRPSLFKSVTYSQLARLPQKLVFGAVSTDQQFLTLIECKKHKIGCCFLFKCL